MYYFSSEKMKRQKPSGAHFRKLQKKEPKATASFQVFMVAFLKGSSSSASSDIPGNQQNESIVSKNLVDESAVS
jgi:hypothetical protein